MKVKSGGFVRGLVDEGRQRSYFVFEIELYRPMGQIMLAFCFWFSVVANTGQNL